MPGQHGLSLSTLRHSERLLADHVDHIAETVNFLKRGGDPKWPRASEERFVRIADEAHRQLLGSFATLPDRARGLVERCSRGTEMIVNGAQLQESRNAIAQGGKIEKLTLLAFFFVPLTFTSGIFGMDFSQFGPGEYEHLDLLCDCFACPSAFGDDLVLGPHHGNGVDEKGNMIQQLCSYDECVVGLSTYLPVITAT